MYNDIVFYTSQILANCLQVKARNGAGRGESLCMLTVDPEERFNEPQSNDKYIATYKIHYSCIYYMCKLLCIYTQDALSVWSRQWD